MMGEGWKFLLLAKRRTPDRSAAPVGNERRSTPDTQPEIDEVHVANNAVGSRCLRVSAGNKEATGTAICLGYDLPLLEVEVKK